MRKSKKISSRSKKQKSRKVVRRSKRQKSKCYPKVYDRKTKRCRKSRKTKRTTSNMTIPRSRQEAQRRELDEERMNLLMELSLVNLKLSGN